MQDNQWFTYILECRDGTYYTGITNDLAARLDIHNSGKGPAWTRARRPVSYRYAEVHGTKSAARRRKIEIKGWRREKKERLLSSAQNLVR